MVTGFRNGFDLCYEGPLVKVRREVPNLKLYVGSQIELWNKIMLEVKAGRYVGPFQDSPFDYYVQSPVGLVPKDKDKKTRLIFHLSYPKTGNSVNSGIPKIKTSVKYPDFMEAVRLCMGTGHFANCTKSDMSMAFHNVPLAPSMWSLLVIKVAHPITERFGIFSTNVYHSEAQFPVKFFRNFWTVSPIW